MSYIKEGEMRSGPLCALLWRILTWCTRKQVTLKHDTFQAGIIGSRQAVQARPDHPNSGFSFQRSSTLCSRWHRPQIDLFATRFNNKSPLFCVTGTGSPGHSSGCAQSAMVGSKRIHLLTISHIGQSGGEVTRLPM